MFIKKNIAAKKGKKDDRDAGRPVFSWFQQQDIAVPDAPTFFLKENEVQSRVIDECGFDWEYWVNPGGQFIYVSPSCKNISGYSAEELIQKPDLLLSVTHPDDRDRIHSHYQNALLSREVKKLDFRIITKSGAVRWLSHICHPLYDSDGNYLGYRVSNHDITKQKSIEEVLRKKEELLRQALDASSDGVWDRNLITNEVYLGDNWYRLLGFTEEDLRRKKISWEELINPRDMKSTFQARDDHIQGRTERYEVEFRMRNKAGEWQWILSRGKVIEWDAQDRPLRFIGIHLDITKRKEMEIELQQARHDLQKRVEDRTNELEEMNIALEVLLKKRERDKSKLEEQILSNVARLIEPYIEIIEKSGLDEQQKSLIKIMKCNLEELTSPFAQLLSSKFMKLTPSEIQIANLVKIGKSTKDIAELMNLSPGTISIHRKNIRKKLGVTNQQTNLQTILSTCSTSSASIMKRRSDIAGS